jgi:anaerobic selenocysteine-containing dehydrogenase
VIRWLFEEGKSDDEFLATHATGASELRRRAETWTLDRAAAVTGVPAADIEALATLYSERRPAVVRCGWGLERNRNGGSAAAAVIALPAVAGHFGVRGGGYTLSNSGAWRLDPGVAVRAPEPETRVVNMNRLGEALLEARPPVKALFVYNCNPLATMPAQERVRAGLARDDLFTVVFEQVMTDTARYADVLLPATTFLERAELARGYGAFVLQRLAPVIAPPGEARSNHEVFAELCRRTGVAEPGETETVDELAEAILETDPRRDDVRRSLREHGVAFPEAGASPVQMVDVSPHTEDGKVHLVPEALDREAPQGLYAYRDDPGSEEHPLALISPSTDRTISSSLGELRRRQVPLELHHSDARARGIADGDAVRVFNGLGEVRCRAKLSAEVRPGVVSLAKGLWSHNTLNGATSNALVPDTLADLGGGACFNDARVQVERC